MAGMLQILTYLLGVYLVVKGIEVLSINEQSASAGMRGLGRLTLIVCIIAAIGFAVMQDNQAQSMSSIANGVSGP